MIASLIFIVVAAISCGLVYWLVDFIPIAEPFNRIVKVVLVVAFVVIVIYVLLSLIGYAPATVKLP